MNYYVLSVPMSLLWFNGALNPSDQNINSRFLRQEFPGQHDLELGIQYPVSASPPAPLPRRGELETSRIQYQESSIQYPAASIPPSLKLWRGGPASTHILTYFTTILTSLFLPLSSVQDILTGPSVGRKKSFSPAAALL